MRVEWHGQSAFTLTGAEAKVLVDPFGDMGPLAERGIRFEYPPIEVGDVDLVLVTHEHRDHNAVEVASGEPTVLRSTAGNHDSPIGRVLGVASEHDAVAGAERGPNTIFVFELDGVRVAHFGDFGQAELRPEQAAHLGDLDLLILPVGGGPTIGAAAAAEIAERLAPRWVMPMHYRTPKADFLPETEEQLVTRFEYTERFTGPSFETTDLPSDDGPVVLVPAVP